MKRLFSMVMVTLLVVSLFAGCSQQNAQEEEPPVQSNNDASDPTGTEDEKIGANINKFGWEVPDKTLEFSYYAGQDNPDTVKENSKIMNDFLLKEFNVKLNKLVYDVDQKQKLNLMLASGDYPDVITGLSEEDAQKFVMQGKAIELSQYIDTIAPNIKDRLGDYYKSYFTDNGKLYYLPQWYGYLEIPDYSAHVRYDWWKEMGFPAFETPDEYFDLLKQMQAAHPVNGKGEKTYALSGYDMSKGGMANVLGGIWGLKNGYKEVGDGNLVHWVNTPEGLEMTQYLNRYYVEGLLDPDIFINKFDDWKAKFSSERIVGAIGGWWISWNAGHEVWQKANADWNDEQRFVQVKLKAPSAAEAYLSPKNARGGSFTIITDKAKDPESILRWLNFQVTELGNKLIGWGPPDVEHALWSYTDPDTYSFTADQKQAMIEGRFDFAVADSLGAGLHALIQGLYPMSDKTSYWFDQNFNEEAKWKKIMNDNMKGTIYDNTFQTISIPADSPLAMKNQQILDAVGTGWAKAVLSETPEELLNNFNEMKEKANSLGLKEIEQYRSEIYKQRLAEWK